MASFKNCLCLFQFVILMMEIISDQGSDRPKYKILFVNAPSVDSHRKSTYPLARKLGQLGHNVTLLVDGIEGVTKIPGAKELEFVNPAYLMVNLSSARQTVDMGDMTWKIDHTTPFDMKLGWQTLADISVSHLREKRAEIEEKLFREKWDLVMVDSLFTPMGILVALVTGSPMASVHTSTMTVHNSFQRKIPYPWSYYPTMFMASTIYDYRNFIDRTRSLITDLSEIFVYHFQVDRILPAQFFSYHKAVSTYTQDSTSQFFALGFPPQLDYVRPWTRDMVPFAGTCPSAGSSGVKDEEIRAMIEDPSSKGTVVIAFGHMVEWSKAPDQVRRSFAQALNLLKDFRIIWQYNGNTTDLKLDKHVKCMKWLPQEVLLRHPNTKLFVSHGGLKSLTETICAGVPALVIPFFAEQIRNAHLLSKSESGVALNKFNLTAENLFQQSSRILNDDSFSRNIKRLRSFFNDQPIPTVDNGAFWTEFVIKYQHKKLARFFRLREASMSWIQAFMIDLFVIYFVIPISSLYYFARSLRSDKYF